MELDRSSAFVVFDRQDSGCVSYGIETDGRRLFVKTATTDAARTSLGRAIRFHRAVRHPAIVALVDVVDTAAERTLVYPWCDGIVLNHATVDGSDRSGLERFRACPDRRSSRPSTRSSTRTSQSPRPASSASTCTTGASSTTSSALGWS